MQCNRPPSASPRPWPAQLSATCGQWSVGTRSSAQRTLRRVEALRRTVPSCLQQLKRCSHAPQPQQQPQHQQQQQQQQQQHPPRRQALASFLALVASLGCGARPCRAGLVQFPASQLHNRYILIRAGSNVSELEDAVLTNPAFKQSSAAGLSELGKAQVVRATVPALRALDVCGEAGCWLWPSVTQNAYQTAEILAYSLGVGRSRIVPEYSFLDARGLGALDGLRVASVNQQVRDGDLLGASWQPPPGYDGTPNESAAQVLTRMRQVLSVTETQYSGEDVVFIAPDSDTLSILQAAVLGLDLRRHKELGFRPGEARPLLLAQPASMPDPASLTMSLPCPNPPSCV